MPTVRILGIDPGSQNLGLGVIEVNEDRFRSFSPKHIHHQVLRMSASSSFAEKLAEIHQQVLMIIGEHQPSVVAVENIFLGKNPHSAFKLGHVRGVLLLAAAQHKLEVAEYAPQQIKKAVTGSGRAEKEGVRAVVLNLLGIQTEELYDATDALAVALTHSFCGAAERKIEGRI